jgi:hypothetical protein
LLYARIAVAARQMNQYQEPLVFWSRIATAPNVVDYRPIKRLSALIVV